MALASLQIKQEDLASSTYVVMKGGVLTVNGKKNNGKKPNANFNTAPREIQTESIENLGYTVTGVQLTDASGTLTYSDVLALYKSKYDGTNAATIKLAYGKPGLTSDLTGVDDSTTEIPVVMETFTVTFSAVDSEGGYRPMVTMVFSETS